MESAANHAAEKWIHRRVWLRWIRLFYGVLFLWAAGLGLSRGSWKWVLWPFLVLAAFLIFRDWLRRIEPKIAGTLSVALAFSVLAHNLVGTVWPELAKRSPLIAEGLIRRLAGTEVRINTILDPCGVTLQKLMTEYKFSSEDVEAANFKRELDALNAAREANRFGPAEEARERELFGKYRQLIQRSSELKQMIQESGCEANGLTRQVAASPPAVGIRERIQKPSTPAAARTNTPATSMREESIRVEYDALMNRFLAVESSLRHRFQDVGRFPIKTEITTAISECRSDLAASLEDLSFGRLESALLRLDRVRRNLKYLESL